jgi:hypothetical protein
MNDIEITRMVLTTAAFAAAAALLAGPAGATPALADTDDGGYAATAQSAPIGPGTIPYMSHGIGVDESLFSGEEPSLGLTGDSALTRVQRETAVAATDGLDPAIRTAMEARQAAQSSTQAAPVGPGTIPYMSHGIGVDETLFSGQQPSLGLTGDSPLTRGDMPSSPTTQTVSSGDDFEWTWVGVGAGLAALLAAAMGGLYLSARHRGRIALP